MGPRSWRLVALISVCALVLPAAAQAAAKHRTSRSQHKAPRIYTPRPQAGVQHLHYKFGPIHITPGQNTINIEPNKLRPSVPGYITKFVPNLKRTDGSVPRVDVIHLHHGVWLVNGYPTWAAGEEKTRVYAPKGFGWSYKPSDQWLMNYMIHNLTPNPDTVYITYDIDFIPATAPQAKTITPVHTQWMDVEGIKAYPVFDALRAYGNKRGLYTYPDMAPTDPYKGGRKRNEWTVPHDLTMVGTAGHLHPGGKETFLTVSRGGKTVRLFTSKAHYYDPAGAVSWDVSMTATPPNWRVALKKGDVVAVHGTYDVSKASWYESMAIMPAMVTDGPDGGVDPFTHNTNVPGLLTHGHLPENDHHGGGALGLPNPAKVLDGPVARRQLTIEGFVTSQGDLSGDTGLSKPPVIHQGQSVSFLNVDAKDDIYHTITACKQPCNKEAGIAYPLADGPVDFDSGELGNGPPGFTAAANRTTWSTPVNLKPGTYTYFCRIHPFMRGSFRVVK
jgi:plastocyanin